MKTPMPMRSGSAELVSTAGVSVSVSPSVTPMAMLSPKNTAIHTANVSTAICANSPFATAIAPSRNRKLILPSITRTQNTKSPTNPTQPKNPNHATNASSAASMLVSTGASRAMNNPYQPSRDFKISSSASGNSSFACSASNTLRAAAIVEIASSSCSMDSTSSRPSSPSCTSTMRPITRSRETFCGHFPFSSGSS